MKNIFKLLSILICITLVFAMFSACGDKPQEENNDTPEVNTEPTHTVMITVKDYGDITLDLYGGYAPETVANFVKLVEEGFYDGTIFHRVYKDFMIQGGGFTLENTEDPKEAETIKGEFSSNGFTQNKISHKRGIISMARTDVPDSASSQFFIVHGDSEFLNGNYAAFGVVTDGMEVVDAIANCEVVENPAMPSEISLPTTYPVIETIVLK